MAASDRSRNTGSRRVVVVLVLLALFVLFDIGLLGWLIFRSLSKRETERLLIETRTEAEQLASDLAGGADEVGAEDLYTLVAVEREQVTYIDSILTNRDIVQTVEIRDAEGRLVFRARAQRFDPYESFEAPPVAGEEMPPHRETTTRTHEETLDYDMSVPIGELGILHIGISQIELERRIELLRGELTRQVGLIGVVTLVVLALAYLTIWWLWRRGRRLEERAAEQERMAYIGTLASGLAHEIRNPLNSLNLNMQLLEEEAGGGLAGGSGGRLMAITRDEIRRLERLVTHFLLYAKPRPLELEALPAVALLERCRALLEGEFEALGATLEVRDRSAGALVSVDEEQMTQLLVNLAQNALAATEESGRPPRVTLTSSRVDGGVDLEVADNGAGIPEEERERIFDLFYSTRKGGTGLGLAVVRRVAQAHGAELTIDSVAERGTRVRVTLEEAPPAARAEATEGAPPAAVAPAAAPGSPATGSPATGSPATGRARRTALR